MTAVKIIFTALLCVPLFLLAGHFFTKLVDELTKKQ